MEPSTSFFDYAKDKKTIANMNLAPRLQKNEFPTFFAKCYSWVLAITGSHTSSSSSRFYYFTRGVPTGCAFLLGTLGDVL